MGTDNSPAGSWLGPAGGLAKSGKKKKVCKAFGAAVRDWCSGKANTKGRQFADVVLNKLHGVGPMGREVPILTIGSKAAAVAVGTLAWVAGGGPGADGSAAASTAEQGVADRILQQQAADAVEAPSRIGGMLTDKNVFTDQMNTIAGDVGGGKYGMNFADGQFSDGQLLEIKSPMDKMQPGQAERYNDASMKASGKPLAVASCEECATYVKCPSPYKCSKGRYG